MPVRSDPATSHMNKGRRSEKGRGGGRTMHSNEAASAPELETSKVIPFLFINKSCNFSKFIFGGSKWRLSHQKKKERKKEKTRLVNT
jgi:hypothetical protein